MRSLLPISLVSLMAVGACSQSLTHDMSGAGGTGGISGGTGGEGANARGGSSGGTGGSGSQSTCDALAAAYQTALSAARSCTIGGTGQCQQLVNVMLSFCPSCQVYVNDASALNHIQQTWEGLNCRNLKPAPQCSLIGCPIPVNNVCAENPDDSSSPAGVCSPLPGTGGTGGSGATGGSSGAGGSSVDGGSPSCGDLTAQYAAALSAAKSCDVGAPNQCAQQVAASLSICSSGCTAYVNDATTLNQIRQQWDQAGCGNVAVLCPLIACVGGTSGVCAASDAGGGSCASTFTGEPFGLK